MKLLEIDELSVSFYQQGRKQEVLSKVSMQVARGEVVAVIGASGAGKSILASAILGILPANAGVTGSIFYEGTKLTEKIRKGLRGREIALIPQSVTYLDPLMKVGSQVDGHRRPIRLAKRNMLFERLGLAKETGDLYPYQLSGGMTRRVLVSTALVHEAQLIIADEPTPGMSPDQAREAVQIFRELAWEGKGVILITHDVDLAVSFADRIVFLYRGMTMETAFASDFYSVPDQLRHPYSKALWRALPQHDFIPPAAGSPEGKNSHMGCPFAPRCSRKKAECDKAIPPLRVVRGGLVRCFDGT